MNSLQTRKEVERLITLTMRAIAEGIPTHLALAALETHLIKLLVDNEQHQ